MRYPRRGGKKLKGCGINRIVDCGKGDTKKLREGRGYGDYKKTPPYGKTSGFLCDDNYVRMAFPRAYGKGRSGGVFHKASRKVRGGVQKSSLPLGKIKV